ncbi:MAG: molybdopterin oxidoreductase [Chloroflexi bacterium]|nr:MAG: molybdopterin oxidoreductase [Chloroflexota bacterium]
MKRILTIAAWSVLLAATGVGLAAVAIRVVQGLGVTNLNYIVPWGVWVAFYIYFIGLSAGSFLLSTMIYVFGFKKLEPIGRLALFSALIALIAGLNFVLLDLGHMERFWTVFVNRNMWSVLEIEIHFYVLYIAVLLAELWLLMRRDLIRCGQGSDWKAKLCKLMALGSRDTSEESGAKDIRRVRILGMLGVPIAIGVHGGTGALFAVVKARPMWYGPLFPIIFIVSALVSGAALLTFLLAFFAGRGMPKEQRDDLVLTLGKITAGLLAFDLLLMWSEFSVGFYGNIPEDIEVLRMMLFGPFWWVFWFVQIIFGAIIPLLLILLPASGKSPRWVGFAGLMIVIGIIGVRLNIVIPALSLPVLPGFDTAYTMLPAPSQTTLAYPPELLTWLTRLAVVAAVVSIVAFGVIGMRRLRGQPGHVFERALAGVGTVAAVLLLVFLIIRWTGQTTTTAAFNLGLTGLDLTHTPIGGILGRTELHSFYIPSPNEWLSSIGVIGLTILMFIIGYNILPLETKEGH